MEGINEVFSTVLPVLAMFAGMAFVWLVADKRNSDPKFDQKMVLIFELVKSIDDFDIDNDEKRNAVIMAASKILVQAGFTVDIASIAAMIELAVKFLRGRQDTMTPEYIKLLSGDRT